MACEKYCMHLFPSYLLVIVDFFYRFIAKNFATTSSKIFFILSIGKLLSIDCVERNDFLHSPFHSPTIEPKEFPWLKFTRAFCSLTNRTLTNPASWEREKFVFYLPLVNNWNAKVIRKRNVFRMASSDSVSIELPRRIIFYPFALLLSFSLTNARINA